MAEARLHNRRVLVVEDEYLIAQSLERGLQRAGATVVGPVPNIAGALALLVGEHDLDAAVLDINLGEQKVYPVVDALIARGVHCVFATGTDGVDVPAAYAAIARCEKPINTACLVEAILDQMEEAKSENGPQALQKIRDQLLLLIELAGRAGYTVLAAKLSESLDAAR